MTASSIPPLTISPMHQTPLKSPTVKAGQSEESLKKTAQDFEALALGEMLQPMFETVDTSKGMFGGGEAEEQFRSLQVLDLGKQISRSGGIGIAKQVYKAMQRMQEQSSSET